MHPLTSSRSNDKLIVKKAIDAVKLLLIPKHNKNNFNLDLLIDQLNYCAENIDYSKTNEGVGIYVSSGLTKLVHFPFPVQLKISLDDSFLCRELYYYKNAHFDYKIISIGESSIHFYNGHGKTIEEIDNTDFPIRMEEEFEYANFSNLSSFGSAVVKRIEQSYDSMEKNRPLEFHRTADEKLDKYLGGQSPLIIEGKKNEIAEFLLQTEHMNSIIGKIIGNHSFGGVGRLGNLAWQEIQNQNKKKDVLLIDNLHDCFAKGKLAYGIENVWQAIIEGKGLDLILEKDYKSKGYFSKDGKTLLVSKPADIENYCRMNDAVERIIKAVMEKGGKVVFLENRKIEDFNCISLKMY